MISVRKLALPILGMTALAITACGGGGGSSPVAPPAKSNAQGALSFKITMPAPPPNASAGVRKRFSVSSATQGLVIQAYVSPYTGSSSPVATGTFDVSATSGLCTTNPADLSRTCSASIPVPVGTYDLQFNN